MYRASRSRQRRLGNPHDGSSGNVDRHGWAADAPISPEAVTSSVLRRYQQWLLIGGAAVVGIALALLVVGILSSRRAGKQAQQDPIAKSPADSQQKTAAQDTGKLPPKEDGKSAAEDSGAGESMLRIGNVRPRRRGRRIGCIPRNGLRRGYRRCGLRRSRQRGRCQTSTACRAARRSRDPRPG